ncbi:hypothetical protein L204_102923 [Cryptococcus depauperatus]
MPPQQELIISASSATTGKTAASQTAAPAIHLHNLSTSSLVAAFKTSTSAQNSLAYVQSRNGGGGGVFAVQEEKALDQMHIKLHLPEKMTCFTVSNNGCWAAAGSHNGHIYMWELASGLLLSSHTAHYRAITSLIFTPDSCLLISMSLDSSVQIYLVSRLVDPEDTVEATKPYGVLKDHTLGVRCAALGVLGIGGRVWTCSDDGTVKLWSLTPPFDLLCTFMLPSSTTPTTLAVDPSERFFYVGTIQGQVFHVPLFRKRSTIGETSAVEEWGSAHGVDGVPIKTEGNVIQLCEASVTSLALSISSSHLLIGTSAGTIQIHSLPSHQHLRTLSPHAGPVTYLATMLRPCDLVGSTSREDTPIMEIKNLERIRSRSVREAHNPSILLRTPASHLTSLLENLRPPESLHTVGPVPILNDQNEEIERLKEENKRLRATVQRANKINEKMWTGVLDMKLKEQL